MLLRCAMLVFVVCLWTMGHCRGQAPEQVQAAAQKLAGSIAKSGFERVGIFPVLFHEDTRKVIQQAPQEPGNANVIDLVRGTQGSMPRLMATPHGKMYADQMRENLAQASDERFKIVSGESILKTLDDAHVDFSQLHPHSAELKKLAGADPAVQGLIVGVIRERLDPPRVYGSFSEENYAWQDISWELIDLTDGTIRSAATDSHFTSLADAVYRGWSQEYFRWEGDRLRVLFLQGAAKPPTSTVPMRPSDSIDLYKIREDQQKSPHPLFNPNCPFKVAFAVNDKEQLLSIPIATQPIRRPNRKNDSTYEVASGLAFLAMEPGDDLRITINNKSSKRVMVGVFVDGINILGKKRELPDEQCQAWSLQANDKGVFRGWYSGPKGDEQFEEFQLTSWDESIAGKLGVMDQANAITVVIFTAGGPRREQLSFFERFWYQESWWDASVQRIQVTEKMEPAGLPGARADGAGMGGKKPVPGQLNWVATDPPGAILASMTVWYAPRSQLANLAKAKTSDLKSRLWSPSAEANDWKLVNTSPTK